MQKSVLLDTNLLLLLIVGLTSERYIRAHRALKAYTEEDYKVLVSTISGAKEIVCTPNTLTECSNLMDRIAEPALSEITGVFRRFIGNTREAYIESSRAALLGDFPRLGLADSILISLSNQNTFILTANLDLYLSALRLGYAVANFNHFPHRAG